MPHVLPHVQNLRLLSVAYILVVGVLAWLESLLWVTIGNLRSFRRLCLPSSNGVFTARSLGAMYGALANGGTLSDGTTVLGAEAVAELERRAADPAEDVQGWPSDGRQTCGFSP